jgi:hypothetical protein
MNSALEFEVSLITGLMFGIEFPAPEELDEDLAFAMALDLGIVRIVMLKWKTA